MVTMCFSIIIRRVNKDTERETHRLLVAGLHDNPVCVFNQSVSESWEREIYIEMKTEMEADGDKEADRAWLKKKTRRVQKNKVTESRPCCLLHLSEQALLNGTKCCNQRMEAGKHNPSSCLHYLHSSTSYSPGSSNAFSKQEETTASLCHVNQEHSLWTVANNYSNCHCKKWRDWRLKRNKPP